MPLTRNELENQLENLQKQLRSHDSDAEAMDTVRTFARQFIQNEPENEPEGVAFPHFLEMISKSVVNAQEMLDDESARYLRASRTNPHAQPSVFRMPKVTAQMKFGLDVSAAGGLNLLFYSRKSEKTSRNEQGIEFEVVSVPAPPDVLAKIESGTVGSVVDRSARQFLTTIFQTLRPEAAINDADSFFALSLPGSIYLVIADSGLWQVEISRDKPAAVNSANLSELVKEQRQ